ncbi:unnamed protein product, partial [marine sediment metagenome]
GMELETANAINKSYHKFDQLYDMKKLKLNSVYATGARGNATASYKVMKKDIQIHPSGYSNKAYKQRVSIDRSIRGDYRKKLESKIAKLEASGGSRGEISFYKTELKKEIAKPFKHSWTWTVSDDMADVFAHEFGHHVNYKLAMDGIIDGNELHMIFGGKDTSLSSVAKGTWKRGRKKQALKVSEYASKTVTENFAECWTAYHKGKTDLLFPKEIDFIEGIIEKIKR